MSLLGWCHWVQNTSLATTISESIWLFPLIEGSHLLALPLSAGMILLFDLHLLGALRLGNSPKVMYRFLFWSKIGFAVMFCSGILLFIAQAEKAYANAWFLAKMLLILLMGANAAAYQVAFFPEMAEWNWNDELPLAARVCGGLSLIGWLAIIVCGRTMAYQL